MTDADRTGPAPAGRRALVTGASRGLGAALAVELAAAGARVALTARDADALDTVARRVAERSAGSVPIAADLTGDPGGQEADRVVTAARAALGGLDVLVHSASTVEPLGRWATVPADEWERALELNLHAPIRLARAFLAGRPGWGRIVVVTSGAATPPGIPGAGAYSAGKAGAEAFALHLAADLAGTGVTVNAVRPGVLDTDMQARLRAAGPDELPVPVADRYRGLHRDGRLVAPEVAARFVVRLLATDLTGRVLDARRDGGELDPAPGAGPRPGTT